MKYKPVSKEKIEEIYEKIKKLKREKIFLIEDIKTLEIAIDYKLKPLIILITEKIAESFSSLLNSSDIIEDKIFIISEKRIKKLKQVKTNPGIIALFKKRDSKNIKPKKTEYYFALERIQDPGNVGTIIRSALNFNVSKVLLSKGSASIYNPKVVRGSMGTVMIQQIKENLELKKELLSLKEKGFKVYLTSSKIGKSIDSINFEFPSIFVLGNESKGISPEIEETGDFWIKIPTTGKSDSLNVSVSASIIMYEIYKKNH